MDLLDNLLTVGCIDSESLTVVLVAGGSRSNVLDLLGAEAESSGQSYPVLSSDGYSGYAVIEVDGGVLAVEHTGYADPNPRVLAALSGLGGAAAVARSNIQAHERFGCARDGGLLFDSDEFMYVAEHEKNAVPPELRSMFDAAWIDLDAVDTYAEDQPAGIYVAYAMAVAHTGVHGTGDDLRRATQRGYHRVRGLTYLN